ncbi:hypothetical protein P4493_05450 [Bacillus thuringiensis]|uniref:Uncharacterized protein n=3 Tax=Bacillus thuringiensis TaxID=1428 RepID=A0A0B5N7X2_BACTU|nr:MULTISPECIES: hypothetical protein [Bacteria]MEC2534843.1 hypothetical protein [Bacillus cereus]MED1153558.1 hypothetical protein [Bacillus paranthracis]OUB09152.1 hypothetical protein BK708_31940 [Bacillus thuringiensis serovar yunnanensis]AFQ29885.1 hypothetical protein BTF1_28922 [Bacillus thuringiensis HD-789]AJG73859.1 hypothetical protein BF38_5673 [Bacillus thuringiensis]
MATYFKLGFSEYADYEAIIMVSLSGISNKEFIDMYNEVVQDKEYRDLEELAEEMERRFDLVVAREKLEIRATTEVYKPVSDTDVIPYEEGKDYIDIATVKEKKQPRKIVWNRTK